MGLREAARGVQAGHDVRRFAAIEWTVIDARRDPQVFVFGDAANPHNLQRSDDGLEVQGRCVSRISSLHPDADPRPQDGSYYPVDTVGS